DKGMSAHLDVVSLGKRLNVVSRPEVKVSLSRLSRIPFQVIAGCDAGVMQSGKLAMGTHKVLLQGCEPNQEVGRIGLRDGREIFNDRWGGEAHIEIVDIERGIWIVVRFDI